MNTRFSGSALKPQADSREECQLADWAWMVVVLALP